MFYYTNPENGFPFDKLSGGQLDSLMTFTGVFRSSIHEHDPSLILLDEPGQNLGSAERLAMRKILYGQRSVSQLLIVTHHPELLNPYEFLSCVYRVDYEDMAGSAGRGNKSLLYSNVTSPKKKNQTKGSAAPKSKSNETTTLSLLNSAEFQENVFSRLDVLPLAFSHFAVIVEGYSDVQYLETFLSDKNIRAGLKLFPLNGHHNVRSIRVFSQMMHIPHLSIRDSDVLFERPKEDKNDQPSQSSGPTEKKGSWANHWTRLLGRPPNFSSDLKTDLRGYLETWVRNHLRFSISKYEECRQGYSEAVIEKALGSILSFTMPPIYGEYHEFQELRNSCGRGVSVLFECSFHLPSSDILVKTSKYSFASGFKDR